MAMIVCFPSYPHLEIGEPTRFPKKRANNFLILLITSNNFKLNFRVSVTSRKTKLNLYFIPGKINVFTVFITLSDVG